MKKVLNPQDFEIHAVSPADISKITKLVNAAFGRIELPKSWKSDGGFEPGYGEICSL